MAKNVQKMQLVFFLLPATYVQDSVGILRKVDFKEVDFDECEQKVASETERSDEFICGAKISDPEKEDTDCYVSLLPNLLR